MNTAEILHESLSWLSGGGKEKHLQCYNISQVVNSVNLNQYTGLEVSEGGEIQSYSRKSKPETDYLPMADDDVWDVKQVAPEEVYFLTQVILNTLNTEPDRFHDMFDVPGLEAEGWEQLANVARYLISKGWIESRTMEERLLVRLTIEGKIYLRTTNAWS